MIFYTTSYYFDFNWGHSTGDRLPFILTRQYLNISASLLLRRLEEEER